ncbi:MAG: YihY/virulence factor BrkB family protein, partial [Deltaproteobacteria bacterium]
VLSIIRQNDEAKQYFQPAQDVEKLTIKKVIDLLEKQGESRIPSINDKELEKISRRLESIDRLIENSSENILLKDI